MGLGKRLEKYYGIKYLFKTFEGHTHYVMQVAFNPKDNNTFASACLDRTIKVWSLSSTTANFTLEGHEKGVNCVEYYHGGDRSYIVSGADDKFLMFNNN